MRAHGREKAGRTGGPSRLAVAALVVLGLGPAGLCTAQTPPDSGASAAAARRPAWPREAALAVSGPALFLVSRQLPAAQPPACMPCPSSEVPAFDRWAITSPDAVLGRAGLIVGAGLALYASLDLWRNEREGPTRARAALEAGLLAAGAASLVKDLAHRRRPVYFVPAAVDQPEAATADNLRSMPSREASVAAALATSYLLSRGPRATGGRRLLALGAVAIVSGSRVAGGRHFPSDVLAGSALGAASAVLVHRVRF